MSSSFSRLTPAQKMIAEARKDVKDADAKVSPKTSPDAKGQPHPKVPPLNLKNCLSTFRSLNTEIAAGVKEKQDSIDELQRLKLFGEMAAQVNKKAALEPREKAGSPPELHSSKTPPIDEAVIVKNEPMFSLPKNNG